MKFQAADTHYSFFERMAMRILFALVVERHVPSWLPQITISAPHGVGRLIDLHFLLDPSVFLICRYLLWGALVLYILRIAWWIALPYMTVLSIAAGTILNSQGAINHSLQIVSLLLCAQTAAHFYSLFKVGGGDEDHSVVGEDRVISWSQQAIVATYFVSALTKLLHTSGRWFLQSPLIAVQIIKSRDQDYYDRLDAEQYNAGLPVAQWIAAHPLLVGVTLGAGLILELTAPAALFSRRLALFYGLGLVAFHETVQRVMKLGFAYNEYLIWIYLVNVPFWAWLIIRRWRGSRKVRTNP